MGFYRPESTRSRDRLLSRLSIRITFDLRTPQTSSTREKVGWSFGGSSGVLVLAYFCYYLVLTLDDSCFWPAYAFSSPCIWSSYSSSSSYSEYSSLIPELLSYSSSITTSLLFFAVFGLLADRECPPLNLWLTLLKTWISSTNFLSFSLSIWFIYISSSISNFKISFLSPRLAWIYLMLWFLVNFSRLLPVDKNSQWTQSTDRWNWF